MSSAIGVDYLAHAWNSIAVALGSTILAVLVEAPAAYSMAFVPARRTRSVLLWMLSTKFMPAAGVLVPIYLALIRYRWKSWTSRRPTGHGRSSNWDLSCCRWQHAGSPP